MLERHAIVSGAYAGRAGPLRATSACLCPECAAFRERKASEERQRYRDDPSHRQGRLDREAERRAAHGDEINAAARERYRWNDEHAARIRAREAERYWGDAGYRERKKARERQRYRRSRAGLEAPAEAHQSAP